MELQSAITDPRIFNSRLPSPFPGSHRFRTLSSNKVRIQQSKSSSSRPQVLPNFTSGKIDQALAQVKSDLKDLWLRSKYQRGLSGIVSYSPSLKYSTLSRKLTLETTQGKPAAPFLVTVSQRNQERSNPVLSVAEPPQVLVQKQKLKPYSSVLRVSSPNPIFPKRKPAPKLKQVPSPLTLHKRYSPPEDLLKETTDSNVLTYELRCFDTIERIRSPALKDTASRLQGEECPITALRSYEVQRSHESPRLFSSFQMVTQEPYAQFLSPVDSPKVGKSRSVLTGNIKQTEKMRTDSEPSGKRWSEVCMTITKVGYHRKKDEVKKGQEHWEDAPKMRQTCQSQCSRARRSLWPTLATSTEAIDTNPLQVSISM